jgi:hypothetical protein
MANELANRFDLRAVDAREEKFELATELPAGEV